MTLLALIALLLCGCNLASQPDPLTRPTATTFSASASAIPTLGARISTLAPAGSNATATPTPEPTVEAVVVDEDADLCALPDDAPTTLHRVEAEIDPETRSATVTQTTRYLNRTVNTVSDLVFNVEPNYWAGAFTLDGVTGETVGEASITGRRLTVPLTEALEIGCATTVTLAFTLNVPPVSTGVEAFKGYFGHSERQINFGHWLPTVAVRASGGWITREAFFAGEQNVLDVADWEVDLRIRDDSWLLAAPGEVTEFGNGRYTGQLQRARDYSISISPDFIKSTEMTRDGAVVEVYTLGDTEVLTGDGMVDGARHALTMTTRSLELFTELYGPYLYDRMVIVQGDFPDGMEFSGFGFVSTTWFEQYTGEPDGFLMLITVHEVAHQWWYTQVGTDAALTPWLDEALSTYSEYAFIEQFYPNLAEWWWEFRIEQHSPEGFVDSTVYEFTTIRAYINAVYLNGVRMLHQMRQDLGSEAFFGILRAYAESNNGRVVSPTAFWSQFTPEQLAATAETRARYLRRADVGG
ncbi:MAG: hypothetical protein MUF38_15840 [Anaerolineae bacterium]|jgi:hypothetical protein|nr:hypothetical protein [Anaerolineae bacterium]